MSVPSLNWAHLRLVAIFLATAVLAGVGGLVLSLSFTPAPVSSIVESQSEQPGVVGRNLHINARFTKTELCDVRTNRILWRCEDAPGDKACAPPHRREVTPFNSLSEIITRIGDNIFDIVLPLPTSVNPGRYHYLAVSRYRCPLVIPFTHLVIPLNQIVDKQSPDFMVSVP